MLDPVKHATCQESAKDRGRMRTSHNTELGIYAKAMSSRTSEGIVLLGLAVGKDLFDPVQGEIVNVILRPDSRIEAAMPS